MQTRPDGELPSPALATSGMAYLPGGTFRMGSDTHYAEEAPAHEVFVDAFHIDRTLITNESFAAFVAATGYQTVAELPPDAKDWR